MAEDQNRTLQDKFMLRFPDGMRERLKQDAAKNARSLNAEIIHRLEGSMLGMPKHTSVDDIAESYTRKFANAPYRPGLMQRFQDLYLNAKQTESSVIRSFYEGAQNLLNSAKVGDGAEPDVKEPDVSARRSNPEDWDWSTAHEDVLPTVKKSRPEKKKSA